MQDIVQTQTPWVRLNKLGKGEGYEQLAHIKQVRVKGILAKEQAFNCLSMFDEDSINNLVNVKNAAKVPGHSSLKYSLVVA